MTDAKLWGIKNNKRVPIQQVVDAAPIVIDEKDPDLIFLNAKKVITTKNGKINYDKYSAGVPGIGGGGDVVGNTSTNTTGTTTTPEKPVKYDVPDLTDIESVTYEQYYDTVTKGAKVKAILKIRNSSVRGTDVVGVDARIYNPSA